MNQLRRLFTSSLLVTAFLVLIFAAGAQAALVLDFGVEFSGGMSPQSATLPWIRATLVTDGNDVLLTMQALNLVGTEFVDEWMFNFTGNISNLTITPVSTSGTLGPITASKGADAFKADGDGYFDIKFVFDNAPPADRFTNGDSATYRLAYTSPITELHFDTVSAPGGVGGHGPFTSAAHVQSIGTSGKGSGWIAPLNDYSDEPVPEPAPMVFIGVGLMAIGLYRVRK